MLIGLQAALTSSLTLVLRTSLAVAASCGDRGAWGACHPVWPFSRRWTAGQGGADLCGLALPCRRRHVRRGPARGADASQAWLLAFAAASSFSWSTRRGSVHPGALIFVFAAGAVMGDVASWQEVAERAAAHPACGRACLGDLCCLRWAAPPRRAGCANAR